MVLPASGRVALVAVAEVLLPDALGGAVGSPSRGVAGDAAEASFVASSGQSSNCRPRGVVASMDGCRPTTEATALDARKEISVKSKPARSAPDRLKTRQRNDVGPPTPHPQHRGHLTWLFAHHLLEQVL